MSIRIPANNAPPTEGAADSKKAGAAKDSVAATLAEAKTQQNTAIVKASIEVSIGAGNDSLALLLKSAITGINELLEPEFGPNALQNAASQDNAPEGTAGRIVSLSTGFFEAYKLQNPGKDQATALKDFMATIKSGFEQGYGEARDILEGMQVLKGEIASNIDKTYELVMQGYADFEARFADSDAEPVA